MQVNECDDPHTGRIWSHRRFISARIVANCRLDCRLHCRLDYRFAPIVGHDGKILHSIRFTMPGLPASIGVLLL